MAELTRHIGAVEVTRVEERLDVGTQVVPVERVLVRKRVVTETRQIEVQLRREELVVERTPVEPGRAGAGVAREPVVLTLVEEEPVVTVRARPYERVTVVVDRVTEQRPVTAELRREQVEVAGPDGNPLVEAAPAR
jgi:uncharacterized protein (TIGR02271 family)